MMIRDVDKDAILNNVGPEANEQIVVQQGTRLVVDIVGIRMCIFISGYIGTC